MKIKRKICQKHAAHTQYMNLYKGEFGVFWMHQNERKNDNNSNNNNNVRLFTRFVVDF